MGEQASEKSKREKGRKADYVIDMPEMSPVTQWILIGVVFICLAVLVPDIVTLDFYVMGWAAWVPVLIILIGIPVTLIMLDSFVNVPLGIVRSVQKPANLQLIKKRSITHFFFHLQVLILKYNGRHIRVWALMLFVAAWLLAMAIEQGFSIQILIPILLVWLFILESGIMASMMGRVPYSSIPVFLFWTVPVLVGATWGGIKLGRQLVIGPIEAQVDMKRVPSYWQSSVPGIGEMQIAVFCGLMLIAWLVTAIVATVLFRRLVRKKIREMGSVTQHG